MTRRETRWDRFLGSGAGAWTVFFAMFLMTLTLMIGTSVIVWVVAFR